MILKPPAPPRRGARGPAWAAACLSLCLTAACVPENPTGAALRAIGVAGPGAPATQWDHRPEAPVWTASALMAVAARDEALAARVPRDIAAFCPGYPKADLADRRAFWVGLMSAIARYESRWNPEASGGGGRYIGLMQISPRSAANYGCDASSSAALKDGGANLACAARMIAHNVERDEVVAGRGSRGAGRDWMPLRNRAKRAEVAAWTSAQPYCRA